MTPQPQAKAFQDPIIEFHKSWSIIKSTLEHPDERQLTRGITATDVPTKLRAMGDALVHETSLPEYSGGTGPCMEYLLKNDVLGTLVRLSEPDRPAGILAEVLKTVSNMVVLLDEEFLVHSAVHKAIIRLLRACTDDEFQDKIDGKGKVMGAAAEIPRGNPSDYELDLVDLLCVLCSRIRTYRHLLLIFFHDKNWFQSDSLSQTEDENQDEEGDEENEDSPPSPVESMSTITSAPSAKKPDYEFLLFNYLLRYVHREGRIGDFARAGVLFLIDVAMSAPSGDSRQLDETGGSIGNTTSDPIADASLALAEYILDGDFADVLAAGLVAVYSVLPSKLEIRAMANQTDDTTTMSLGVNIYEKENDTELERARTFGLELSSDPDFQSRLHHFLQIIEFLQDILRRTTTLITIQGLEASALVGTAITASVLQGVKTIFLENVLYASILESSDADGSAVAVLSYIDMILQALPDGQLAELVIDFLMNEDDVEGIRPVLQTRVSSQAKRQSRLRKRKSSAMMLLELEAPKGPQNSTYFSSLGRFTLKDLVFSNLRSTSDAASTAVLRLLQTLLSIHPRLTVDKLLVAQEIKNPLSAIERSASPESDEEFTYPTKDDEPVSHILDVSHFQQPGTSFSTHEREIALYLNLISRVDPTYDGEGFSTGYDSYIQDAINSIQSQEERMTQSEYGIDILNQSRLNPNDTLLSLLLQALRTFFAHTAEHNVALTGALSCIASCPSRSLAGWMTFVSTSDVAIGTKVEAENSLEENDDGDDRSIDFEIDRRLAGVDVLPATSIDDAEARPVLHSILRSLVSQLDRYREVVNGFDELLTERRQGLMFAEHLSDALSLSIELDSDSSFFSTIRSTLSPISKSKPTQEATTPPQSKPRTIAASLIPSFLTPKKDKSTQSHLASANSQHATPERNKSNKIAASPFGAHYEKTGNISVPPFVVPSEAEGMQVSPDPIEEEPKDSDEEDVFSAQWDSKRRMTSVKKVTLSQILDNVVILEEFMKEISAIVQARRSLGIDSVRYV